MEFKDKVAVITGGGSGIGRSVALALARLGANVVIADINDDRMANVRQEIEHTGQRVLTVHCDVSKTTDVENLAAQTLAVMGTIDILMNNAGMAIYGKFENMHVSDYEKVLGVNLFGVIRGVISFLPHMIKKGSGYIINTASGAGIDGPLEPYPFSKLAVVGFSERLYEYARPKGIMVSVLCPGLVATNLFADSPFVGTEQEQIERKQNFTNMSIISPVINVLDPDDVAQIVIDHISERKFFILTPGLGTDNQLKNALDRGRDIQKLGKFLQDNFKDPKPDQTK